MGKKKGKEKKGGRRNQGVWETLIPEMDPPPHVMGYGVLMSLIWADVPDPDPPAMTDEWDEDWETSSNLHPSSDHGSDGGPYEVEPSQRDEQMRQFRRRRAREAQEAESPSRAPRSSAVASEILTAT